MRVLLIILIASLLGGGIAYGWAYYGGFSGEKGSAIAFVEAYGAYDELAEQVEALVHLPGTEGNSDREELLSLLNTMLTERVDDAERANLARIAFTHLDAIKKEIDAAQAAQAALYARLQDFDNAARVFHGIELRGHAEEIVLLARKRAELCARITAILAETNDHTYAIITRILADDGALTSEHIVSINEATTHAEERFSELEGLYRDLADRKQELNERFGLFTKKAI